MPAQLKASPRNQALGALADKLAKLKELGNKYEILNQVPLLGGTGLGDLFLGQGPEEVSNWSYGNAPMQIPGMTRIPQMKKGRAQSVADALFMGADIGGLGAVAGALGSRGLRNVAGSASRVGPKSLTPQVGAIKPKGGNWVMDLKGGGTLANRANREFETLKITGYDDERSQALNNWVDTALKKYVKNDMGTPEDPVRVLADRGILHQELTNPTRYNEDQLRLDRKAAGFPEEGFAQSDLGKRWEAASDLSIYEPDLKNQGEQLFSNNPWLVKEGPNSKVYSPYAYSLSNPELGFKHLLDELANATNPESGLPRELLLKYDALPRVTVPQAVERVAKINEWRAAQKIEADRAIANNAATVLHKEYPDRGYKWVELRQPEKPTIVEGEYDDPMFQIPQAQLDRFHDLAEREARRNGLDDESEDYMMEINDRVQELASEWASKNKPKVSKELQEALRYEGDTMGHCVGGYCNKVASGESKIYSLRDAKGQPHTTIEVAPGGLNGKKSLDEWKARFAETHGADALEPFLAENPEIVEAFMPKIVQIKGKANKPPKDEYLPFIRDFIQSGNWSEVNELQNAGLIMKDGQFVIPNPEPDGFAQGGLVRSYNPEEIDEIIAQLVG